MSVSVIHTISHSGYTDTQVNVLGKLNTSNITMNRLTVCKIYSYFTIMPPN